MPIGNRFFNRRVGQAPSSAVLSRFRIQQFGVLEVQGPMDVLGRVGINVPSAGGGASRYLNIAGNVHLRPELGNPDTVELGFGAGETSTVTLLFDTGTGSFTISNSGELAINAPSNDILLGDDVGAVRLNPSGAGSGVGVGSVGAPSRELQVGGEIAMTDGITAPATLSGYAQLYVDSADGDFKIKFGDGTTKTIATDT